MHPTDPRFALNHMVAPRLDPAAFLALARDVGVEAVEIRNDLAGNAILDGTPATRMRALAETAGVRILSINALQRFEDWRPERAAEATTLADYAAAAGAEALVLVPSNDGSTPHRLTDALEALRAILAPRGLVGLIEPLGFATSALRRKSDAVAAIDAIGGQDAFRLVHDTFHHHLAGEATLYPASTGLVHISGVSDPALATAAMRDDDRGLVTADDRLGNIPQIQALLRGGYTGFLSFEPFAPAVHRLADPAEALRRSMDLIREGVSVAA